jgi:SAM-dependent methyltransferase
MSPRSLAGTRHRTRRLRGLARRGARALLLRSSHVDALVSERRNLRIAKGILQIEKGDLEAVVRDLKSRAINPPAPHPPTNPTAYVPSTVPLSGQAYREYITRQIYEGTPGATTVGLRHASSFLQVAKGLGGSSPLGPSWTVVDLAASTLTADSRVDARLLPAEWTERFGLVLCNAVLEHIPHPQRAVDDFCRVLAPGGYLYLEVGFWQPYVGAADPGVGEKSQFCEDYWRATVEGLRVWAAAVTEISCGWADEGVVYYFGRKPATDVDPGASF